MKNKLRILIQYVFILLIIKSSTWMLTAPAFAQTINIYSPIQQKLEYDISYFIPEKLHANGESINITHSLRADIPQPKDILGYELGEQYTDWNDVLKYMEALERHSDRVKMEVKGKTYENRPIVMMTITSPTNLQKLEQIREEHLQLTDASGSKDKDISAMPVVVNLSHSIHGNEASAVNSSLATAYFFAASEDATIQKLLDNTVILMVPGLNPDGINRFANWVNTTHSYNNVADLNSREFSEAWPSSRTNHYWADCNRDWLMCQHPEGQTAVKMYLNWMPNIVSDHHEQGGDSKGFYFSPGHPLRTHPLTPQRNQELTVAITNSTAKALDNIGSPYFSKESYDDFYLGKGGAYGDVQGSIGLLYEQVASRGYLRPTSTGPMPFYQTVRNQSFAAISTVYAAYTLKDELLEYQRNFFANSAKEAAKDPVKGYVFNSQGRKAIEYYFLKNMQHHGIEVHRLNKNVTLEGKTFQSNDSYIIPMNQRFYTKIKSMWENMTEFQDSLFYDISTWTFPHAFNLQYATTSHTAGLIGDKMGQVAFQPGGILGGQAKYAYVFENKELFSHNLMTDLLRKGIYVRISKRPFHYTENGKTQRFGYGTAIVQLQNQPVSESELYQLIKESAERNGIEVHAFHTGLMDDLDFGTPNNKLIQLPKVAMLVGRGMGISDSGEIWHMLDRRFGIPPALIEFNTLHSRDLSNYNVIILANGSPAETLVPDALAKLKEWTNNGGTLIATGNAYRLTNKAKITDFKLLSSEKEDEKSKGNASIEYRPYHSTEKASAGIDGVIFNCTLDITSPLGYGYSHPEVAVLKNGATVMDFSQIKGNSPMHYTKQPYLSGCVSQKNINRIANSPAALVTKSSKGNVIWFADDLNYRSYWFGGTKIFMNAVYFGQLY